MSSLPAVSVPWFELVPLWQPVCYQKRHGQLLVSWRVPTKDTGVVRINFAKYKGDVLESLPDGYLGWMADKLPKTMRANITKDIGLGIEKVELEQKQPVSRSPARRQIFVKERTSPNLKEPTWRSTSKNGTSATLKQKAERLKDALDTLERRGMDADPDTYGSLLQLCADAKAISEGKRLHAHIIKSGYDRDRFLGNLLVHMYGNCGSVEDACAVFDRMPRRNTFSWNSMIAAYAQNGHVEDARSMFDKMPLRNVVSWNSMIGAYAQNGHVTESHTQNGHGKEALQLFRQMELEGVKPDKVTFVNALDACTSLAALAQGKGIHTSIVAGGFESDVVVGTALVNMYGKCGCVDDARRVFDKIPQRNVVSWTAMIAVYAQNGLGKEALKLFGQMELVGVKPNTITFLSVLFACSHGCLLDDGWRYFVAMSRDHGIIPSVEHYGCMIDLIGRAGQLDEAEDIVSNMPCEPDAVSWITLLGACRIRGNVEVGTRAAEHVFELDSKNPAPYVLLSNTYAAAGRQDDAANVRKAMEDRGIKKHPGRSCIEIMDKVHEFVMGDVSHPQKEEIHVELQRLNRQMMEAGYMPDTKAVLHDVEEEEKEHMLCYHSEKLAIVFGLISTPAGAPLRIIKNLRVCSDCHAATQFISKIVGRKIIVRDANRFHHFELGLCSCGGYW